MSDKLVFCSDASASPLPEVLGRYGLDIRWVDAAKPIPGSFWGDSEAGLVGNLLYLRADTPLHSALHEACHYVCMDSRRREQLHTDAGGDYDEENGVCYLQVLLADHLSQFGRQRMFRDMDRWGYTFRLGSARAWFERDVEDARSWLLAHGIIGADGTPAWKVRAHG